jgi:hypothetical protein
MPYWVVVIIIVVLIVGYYLLTQQAKERRRERVGADFAKTPNFYANQTYTDAAGEAAIGIDDRGRRIAVARKHAQPRTKVYSFAHILSAEVIQNDEVIAAITPEAPVPGSRPAGLGGGVGAGGPAAGPAGSLFGSTGRASRQGVTGLPVLSPVLGQVATAGVRIKFRNGDAVDQVVIHFYQGKPVNVDSVVGERAFAEAQVLLGSLDIAMKRAGVPPKGPTIAKTPVL